MLKSGQEMWIVDGGVAHRKELCPPPHAQTLDGGEWKSRKHRERMEKEVRSKEREVDEREREVAERERWVVETMRWVGFSHSADIRKMSDRSQ